MKNQFARQFILFLSLFCGIIALLLYLNTILQPKLYNIETKIQFLQSPKDIEKKDFVFILKGMEILKKTQQETLLESPQLTDSKDKLESNQPLRLEAILDKSAYIDNKWHYIGDTFIHDSKTYKIQTITSSQVILIDSNDNKIILEVFPKHNDLFFEVIGK